MSSDGTIFNKDWLSLEAVTYLLLGWFWNSWIHSDILAGKASPNLQAMSSGRTSPLLLKFKSLSEISLERGITEGVVEKGKVAVDQSRFVYDYCRQLHGCTLVHYISVHRESQVASRHPWVLLLFAFHHYGSHTHFRNFVFLSQSNHCCVVLGLVSCFFQETFDSLLEQFQVFINLIFRFITSALVFPGARKKT